MDAKANRIAVGAGSAAVGALVAIGPQTLFRICDQGHHAAASVCFWTARSAIGLGAAFALLGAGYLFIRGAQGRAGVSLAMALNALLTFATANFLIGMDEDPMMACRVATLPALNVICAIAFLLAAANTARLLLQDQERERARLAPGGAL